MKQLWVFCESGSVWARETIERLVGLESPTSDKAAVDQCVAEGARLLEDAGARVHAFEMAHAGNAVLGEFGDDRHARRVLVLGHLDTVWPVGQLARMPLRVEGVRLHGPGTFDMKGGVAVGLLAVRALCATRPGRMPRIAMLLTGDEESGSHASRALIEEQASKSDAVLVLEPPLPGGRLKTSRKGCGEFELRVRGVPAHAGIEPEKGASAILELAAQVLAIEHLEDREKGTTANVGLIAGGIRSNVVPGEAHAAVDVRAATAAEAERLSLALRALRPTRPRTSLEVVGGFDRPPLERTDGVAALYALAREAGADFGFEVGEGSTGGASDGNITAALGVPTLDGLGAEGDGAHAEHEHVRLDRLGARAALVAALLARCGER